MPQALQVRPAPLDPLVLPVLEDPQDRLDQRVLQALQAQPALQDPPELPGSKDRQDPPVLLALREALAQQA